MPTTYKVLGQSAPASTANANLYTVPAATSAVISTLHIANVTAIAATARIYIRVAAAAAADGNALFKDISIPANSIYAFTEGITLAATDVVTVQTATANALTFMAFGSEIS